jgi:2-polyprenyl-3-methyl-5-hydroxy-6-metoxy-1,4-benzoquinol methylase
MTTKFDEFKCVLCASTSTPTPVLDRVKGDPHNMLKVVRCTVCGHSQLNPPNYSIDHYKEDGQVNFVVHDYGTPLEKVVEHSWIEATRRVKRFGERGIALDRKTTGKPLRVLDIGGGYGFFASELKRQYPNIDVQVMEPSGKRAEMGRAYMLAQGDARPVPEFVVEPLNEDFVAQHRGSFDIVTLWHVLEHVTNPVEFLKWAVELASPLDGVVCVEVPNVNDELMQLSEGFRDRNYMMEHISYFSRHTLETVARQAAPESKVTVWGYQRYGIFNYFHWIHFNKPQGASPDLFQGKDRWWLEASWRATREEAMTSDALFISICRDRSLP